MYVLLTLSVKVRPALETENKVIIERIVELENRIAGMVVTVRAMNVCRSEPTWDGDKWIYKR